MTRAIARLSPWVVWLVVAVSVPWIISPTPAGASGVSVQVSAVTQTVTNAPASQTTATVGCPPGTVMVGGGIRAFHGTGDQIVTSTVYEPINGLVIKGTAPSDAVGGPAPANDPANWTAFGGFAGQSETGDDVTGFAMCSTGGPTHTALVTATVNGPSVASTTASVTASCPGGTRLVGGGAQTAPASSPSLKPVGSYPSDATGSTTTVTDPNSWTAVGESGGQASVTNTTTAFAVCSTDATLHTEVVRSDDVGHPAGQGNSNPGQDPVATATATCPAGTSLLDGGALADSSAAGGVQQGVHLRGSYPSDASAQPVADGAGAPRSWSTIVQSGGQATPGTNTHAFALCAQPIGPPADLSIVKYAFDDEGDYNTPWAGQPFYYVMVIHDAGPNPATGVLVTDRVPAGLTVNFASPTQGSCSVSSGTVTCSLGSLAAAGSKATAYVAIGVAPTSPGVVTNTATVRADQPDPNLSNNTSSLSSLVEPVDNDDCVPGVVCTI